MTKAPEFMLLDYQLPALLVWIIPPVMLPQTTRWQYALHFDCLYREDALCLAACRV
jgi:hypothetical protein